MTALKKQNSLQFSARVPGPCDICSPGQIIHMFSSNAQQIYMKKKIILQKSSTQVTGVPSRPCWSGPCCSMPLLALVAVQSMKRSIYQRLHQHTDKTLFHSPTMALGYAGAPTP